MSTTTTETRAWNRYSWLDTVMDSGLTPRVKEVLLLLARNADGNGRRVHPGNARIAEALGCSTKTVERAMSAARDAGLIVRVSRARRWAGKADEYMLVCAAHTVVPRSTDTAGGPTKNTTTGGRPRRPQPLDEVGTALAGIGRLSGRERARLASRAQRLVDEGQALDVVMLALTAALPDDVVSVASVLHARLLNIEGMTDPQAKTWLGRRVQRWRPARRRTNSTVPRAAADFPAESSQVLAGW